jgi:hypothetical protein
MNPGVGFVGEREEGELDQHGDDQDRQAEVADQAEEIVDDDELGALFSTLCYRGERRNEKRPPNARII